MSLRHLFWAAAAVAGLAVSSGHADSAISFDQARARSAANGKPILFEFNHDECVHCQLATRELDSIPEVIAELDKVILLRLSVLQGEGTELSRTYSVGTSFPVFIIADSAGNVITRWTGYTDAQRFLMLLRTGMSDLVTIDQRVARCDKSPVTTDVTFLTDYFADTRQFARALSYCRQLQTMEPDLNMEFRAFKLAAEGVWSDGLPFDSALTTADQMLADSLGNQYYFGEMALTLANVARKVNRTDILEKYLMAGLEKTATRKDKSGVDLHRNLLADFALHVLQDTTEAISVKGKMLGDGWELDPPRVFQFGEWCLRRDVRLADAEKCVDYAVRRVTEDKLRATGLRLLAQLCYTQGKTDRAIELANEALSHDPSALWFEKKLEEWRASK